MPWVWAEAGQKSHWVQRPTSWAISAAFLGAISGSTEAEQPLQPVLGHRMLATQEAVLAPALAELPMVMFLSFRTDCLLQLGFCGHSGTADVWPPKALAARPGVSILTSAEPGGCLSCRGCSALLRAGLCRTYPM